jgi:ribonuclease VapC
VIGIDTSVDIAVLGAEPGFERTLAQLSLARTAFLEFGKGRRHPAKLNQMDCFSYALAKSLDAPLLFKGEDFLHTDVRRFQP